MTRTEKFLALFPLKGEVTEGILRNARRDEPRSCTGALTLSSALGVDGIMLVDDRHNGDETKLYWGREDGIVSVEGKEYRVTTDESVDMYKLSDPMKVTFTVKLREDGPIN